VKRWVEFYKAHRAILDSDVIHLRRPDGRDWDGLLHVNPALKEKGLAVLYNPLADAVRRTIRLPLYYTGLTRDARVSIDGHPARTVALDRHFNIELELTIPGNGWTWLLIE
jgi:hypothetical protein